MTLQDLERCRGLVDRLPVDFLLEWSAGWDYEAPSLRSQVAERFGVIAPRSWAGAMHRLAMERAEGLGL